VLVEEGLAGFGTHTLSHESLECIDYAVECDELEGREEQSQKEVVAPLHLVV